MKVKICCIKTVFEAQNAIDAGTDIIGLVGQMPSGPGIITDTQIAEIVSWTNGRVKSYLLTSETDADNIIKHHRRTRTSSIQLVDTVSTSCYETLKQGLGNVEIVQVVHIQDESAIDTAIQVSPYVDAILLDSGNPNLSIKTLGGTGQTHDWSISARIVHAVDKPVFLAGGLHAGNIEEAITRVQPFGIDVCSGVRTDDKLDKEKLLKLMEVINGL